MSVSGGENSESSDEDVVIGEKIRAYATVEQMASGLRGSFPQRSTPENSTKSKKRQLSSRTQKQNRKRKRKTTSGSSKKKQKKISVFSGELGNK